jgi:hypothetical protein
VPPFVGVAVKVTDDPRQIVVIAVVMPTDGTGGVVTVIGILLLVTVAALGQTALDAISKVTISLLVSVVVI